MKLAVAWSIGAAIAATPIAVEGGEPISDLLLQLVSQLGGMGFVVWFAWHTITRTLPSLAEKYDEGLKAAFTEAKQAREEFRTELFRVTDAHAKAANELAASVRMMTEHCRDRTG